MAYQWSRIVVFFEEIFHMKVSGWLSAWRVEHSIQVVEVVISGVEMFKKTCKCGAVISFSAREESKENANIKAHLSYVCSYVANEKPTESL